MRKKLFSMLLALALVASLCAVLVPAASAEEAELDIEFLSDVKVDALLGQTQGSGDFAYTNYNYWFGVCDIRIGGEVYENITLDEAVNLVSSYANEFYSESEYSGFDCYPQISSSPNSEEPWEIGGSYPGLLEVNALIVDEESWDWEVLHNIAFNIVICEPGTLATDKTSSVSIDSAMEVDELCGNTCYDYDWETGEEVVWTSYDWEWLCTFDATVDGTEYTGITVDELIDLLYDGTSSIADSWSTDFYQDYENPWEVGESFTANLMIYSADALLVKQDVTVTLCETKIASITAEPLTYYAIGDYLWYDPTFVVTYKDGTVSNELPNGMWTNAWELEWPTEPGTYTLTVSINDGKFEVPVEVTVLPAPITITSDLKVDEIYGWLHTDEETGDEYKIYDWFWNATFDATINGTDYTNITMEDLYEIAGEELGLWDIRYSEEPNQYEDPLEVGDSFTTTLYAYGDNGTLMEQEVTVVICETNIASVSAEPVVGYVHSGWDVNFTATYKDGTTGPMTNVPYELLDEYPEEPGLYTLTYLVANTFEVEMEVTLLPAPIDGNFGDDVWWAYDESTNTLTIGGEGAAVMEGDLERDWLVLLLCHDVKHVVVEEGVESLFNLIFAYGYQIETISLPSTLEELPNMFIGVNGPTSGFHDFFGFEYDGDGLTELVLPEGMTSWVNPAYYYVWGITDIYIPESMTEIALENLVYINYMREQMGLDPQELTIHYAGTEEQWAKVELVTVSEDNEYHDFTIDLTEEEMLEILDTLTIVYEDAAEVPTVTPTDPQPDGNDSNPPTGDSLMVWVLLMVMSSACLILFRKRAVR